MLTNFNIISFVCAAKAYWIYPLPKCSWLSEKNFLHVETETLRKNPSGILSHQLLHLMGSWTYFDCGIPSLCSGSKVQCPSKMFMTKIRKLLKEYFPNFPGSVQFYLLLISLRFWYKNWIQKRKMNTRLTPILVYNVTIHTRFK